VADKVDDEDLRGALEAGHLAKRRNSVIWDPSKVTPSDREVLASLGLKEDGSPL